MPTKFDKLKTYKHKKNSWITTIIIKSIQFGNICIEISADEPRYNVLKKSRSYNYILGNNSKQAKRLHYHKCFQNFKTDMKKTPGHSLTKC